ncbi:MAG: YCF48-related protein [Candidatus Manganitrophus sp.]|nr:YCF48-related protein [Candidatus Manganitrophus sp.]
MSRCTGQKGWMVGDLGTILYTKDGGKSWTEYDSGVTQRLNSIYFTSPVRGWAVGKGGLILQYGRRVRRPAAAATGARPSALPDERSTVPPRRYRR